MSRRGATSALFFLLGLGVLAWLVLSFGVTELLSHVAAAGWSLPLVALLWGVIYGLNAGAWRLCLGRSGEGVGTRELFLVTVSGFAINYITPVVALGGEPYRVTALSAALGPGRALSAVVLYRIVHLLGHMAFLLAGIGVALLAAPMPAAVRAPLTVAAAVIAGVLLLALGGTRGGVFGRLASVAGRFRILAPASRAIDRYRGELEEMDRVITDVYRNDRGAFLGSVAMEFLGRLLMAVEVFVILRALGHHDVTLAASVHVYVLYSIVINLLFFVPLNLGAREGGILLGMEGLSPDPLSGLSVGIILRLREFAWIAAGLAFIPLTARLGRRGTGATPPGEGGPPAPKT